MLQILTIIAPLFLIIFVAAILRRTKVIGESWSIVLNNFALQIGLPVLVFSALVKAPFSFITQAPVLISNSIFIVFIFLLSFILGKILRLNKQNFKTFFFCLVFGSIAYMGIPVLTQVYGVQILPTASLIVAIYLFWVFTIGMGFLDFEQQTKKKDWIKNVVENVIKDPLLIAVVLGIIIASLRIALPNILLTSLDMVTAAVTPTVLIVIGLFIGQSKIGRWLDWVPVLLFSLATLLLLPAIFYFGLKLLNLQPHQFSASIIEAAMPLAITPFALADKFNLNKEFIARAIVLSTILSIISLPFWISIL